MEGWRFSLKNKEQNQVQEPIAEQYAEIERSQDNFYWSQMLKHLPEQMRGPVQTRNSEKHLRGKRSLEISALS